MNNKSYNTLLYLSNLNKIKNLNILNITKLKYIRNFSKKKITEKNIISTCHITGERKKINKKLNLNRHFIRSINIKKSFLVWNKLSW